MGRMQVTITIEDNILNKFKKKCIDEKTNVSYKIQELIEQDIKRDDKSV